MPLYLSCTNESLNSSFCAMLTTQYGDMVKQRSTHFKHEDTHP